MKNKIMVMLIVVISILILGVTIINAEDPEAKEYNWDFEEGNAEDWEKFGGEWTIITDEETGNNLFKSPAKGLAVAGSEDWKNYFIMIDMHEIIGKRDPSSQLNFNFVFRYIDGDNYYRFLCTHQRIELQKVKEGETETWIKSTKDFYFEDNKKYEIRLEVIEKSVKLFVDGNNVLEYDEVEIENGKIGLRSWHTELLVDNVKVLVFE